MFESIDFVCGKKIKTYLSCWSPQRFKEKNKQTCEDDHPFKSKTLPPLPNLKNHFDMNLTTEIKIKEDLFCLFYFIDTRTA